MNFVQFICLLAVFAVLGWAYLGLQNILILKRIKLFEQRQIDREEKFEKWLFEALYSLDHKVLLPPEKERVENEKTKEKVKGRVYSPTKDPMNIFKGEGGNYYE